MRYYFCVPPEFLDESSKPEKPTICPDADLNFFSTPEAEAGRSVDVGDLQRVITDHAEASKIGQQVTITSNIFHSS